MTLLRIYHDEFLLQPATKQDELYLVKFLSIFAVIITIGFASADAYSDQLITDCVNATYISERWNLLYVRGVQPKMEAVDSVTRPLIHILNSPSYSRCYGCLWCVLHIKHHHVWGCFILECF